MFAKIALSVVSSFVLAAASLTGQVFVHVVPVGAVTAGTTVQGVPATVSQAGGGIVDVAAQSVGSPLTAAASFQWFAQSNALWADLDSRFEFSCALAVAVPNASASLPPTELLVELRAPAPTPVWLNVQRLVDLVGTSQLPLWEVDVGDNGSVDYSSLLSTSLAPTSLVVGIAPTYVRVRVGATLAQPGQIDLWFRLLLTPRAGVTRLEAQPGCGAEMLVLPTFGNGGGDLVWFSGVTTQPLQVGVLGFGLAPWFVPSPIAANCLVMPTVDAVFALSTQQPVLLTIPPAVRPLQLWTQGVTLEANGLSTTTTFRIDAL